MSATVTPWVLFVMMLEPGTAGSGGSAPHTAAAVTVPPSPTIDREPSVADLCAAAAAVILSEPARARSLLARARRAGWLPELRIRVDRRYDRNESLDFGRALVDTPAPPVALGTSDDVRYEGRATWDLSRIIFNPDEVSAHAEALRMADARREVTGLVIRLYFERRRLKAEPVTSDASDKTSQVRRELRILELEAELDALTDGAFSRPHKS
jgi:hypothetical protein